MQVEDGLPEPQRTLAFLCVALTLFVAVLDGAIANIALPPIAQDLELRAMDVIWVVNAYQLAVTMVLLPLSSLGEVLGYRRVYLGGLALFTVSSLICAFAGSLEVLILGRVIQGLGAAGIMSVNIALVRFIFPKRQLGSAVGNVAVIVGVSAAIGPTVAGLVLSVAPWEALFLLNVPVGLLAFVVGLRTLPNVPGSGHRFDVGAALLSAATFGLVISGVNGLGRAETLVLSVGQIGLGLLTGAAFARSQLRQPAPMLPVDLLRRPVFALSAATSVVSFSAQAIAFVCLPFFIYGTLGRSPAETGLLMTPWPIATALAAFVSGRLADRLEPGRIAALGLAVFAAGLMSLALLPGAPDNIDFLWRLALAGLGFGIFQAPNNKLLITSAPSSRSGGASGIQSTGRLLGQSLGVAMLAVIFGLSPEGAFPIAMWLATVLALSGVLPSALRRAELHH